MSNHDRMESDVVLYGCFRYAPTEPFFQFSVTVRDSLDIVTVQRKTLAITGHAGFNRMLQIRMATIMSELARKVRDEASPGEITAAEIYDSVVGGVSFKIHGDCADRPGMKDLIRFLGRDLVDDLHFEETIGKFALSFRKWLWPGDMRELTVVSAQANGQTQRNRQPAEFRVLRRTA